MTRRTAPALALTLTLACVLLVPGTARAGGALETIDVTDAQPTGDPDFELVDTVGIHWDSRCIPVAYRMNDTQDPIPNPLGAAFLSLADATAAMQQGFDAWNDVRTSFIDMQVVGDVSNPGTRGFDFVNELTFRVPAGFGAIASSPSVSLIVDVTLADGDDVDGDGDSDVSAAIDTCRDADGDGDVDFPAGDYDAGTILDNDVQFNAAGLRFTVDPAAADTVTASVDLVAVATHEFGHSHGLAHPLNNQKKGSAGDGTNATMFPFIDTGDPADELAVRDLDSDDEAWSSYFYPEGSAASGPGKLQFGDLPFQLRYAVIEGEVSDGLTGNPVAGASVAALRGFGDALESTAVSGRVKLQRRLSDGALFFPPDPVTGIPSGEYTLPVRKGLYRVAVEPIDGTPVPTTSVNFTAQVGGFFGLLGFEEELFNWPFEAAVERDPGQSSLLLAFFNPPLAARADLVTNVNARLAPFGSLDFIGFTLGPGGLWYAVQFPRAEVQQAFDLGFDLLQAGIYRTAVVDASAVPTFTRAALVPGVVDGDGTASPDLADPFAERAPFVGQDGDFAPYFFHDPRRLSRRVERWLDTAPADEDLFLVLQIPQEPWPGASGRAPAIGLDGVPGGVNDVPILGRSFVSVDGVTFTPETRFNFMFSLLFSESP